jgi:hypothetical protein
MLSVEMARLLVLWLRSTVKCTPCTPMTATAAGGADKAPSVSLHILYLQQIEVCHGKLPFIIGEWRAVEVHGKHAPQTGSTGSALEGIAQLGSPSIAHRSTMNVIAVLYKLCFVYDRVLTREHS